MKLGDLIDETLSEIARGVRAAKERSWEVLAIAPGRINGQQTTEITYIDFDVSLVVSEGGELASSKDGRLGGGLTVASIRWFGRFYRGIQKQRIVAVDTPRLLQSACLHGRYLQRQIE